MWNVGFPGAIVLVEKKPHFLVSLLVSLRRLSLRNPGGIFTFRRLHPLGCLGEVLSEEATRIDLLLFREKAANVIPAEAMN